MYIQLTIQSLHNTCIYNVCITIECTLSEYNILTYIEITCQNSKYLTVCDKQNIPKALEWRFLTSTANNNTEKKFSNKIKKNWN